MLRELDRVIVRDKSWVGRFLSANLKGTEMKLDKIYQDSLVQKIQGHMLANLEHVNKQDAVVVAQKYTDAITHELARNYYKRTESDRKLDLHNASLIALRNKCGKYGPRRKQKYWWDTLRVVSPLINIIEMGNNLSMELTKVQAMFEHDWESAAIWTIKEEYTANPAAYDVAEIDLENLGNWMLQAPQYYKSKSELARVTTQAENIFAVAEQFATDGQGARLPMLKRPAPSGRMYYGGINLQNCSSAVRHAALGKHFSYDLKRSVFSWQISILRQLSAEVNSFGHPPGTLHTREFITNRDSVMELLMPCFKDSYYTEAQVKGIIKGAITAMGFGGRRAGGFVNRSNEFVPKGLATVIKHKESRDAFMNHPWIAAFIKEQDRIIELITEGFIAADPDWKTDPRAQRNGRYSAKVFISHLYQATEAKVMKSLMQHSADKQVLLWVHDGFCTRHRVSVTDAGSIMRVDHHMPDWVLEETFHKGWADPDKIKLTAEEQRCVNEQEEAAERAQRNAAEIAMWSAKGYNTSSMCNQPLPGFKFKQNTEGHYGNSTSDYDLGKNDPADDSNAAERGLLNEQQFIERIYGKQ